LREVRDILIYDSNVNKLQGCSHGHWLRFD
jgi:hypothetical protein